MEALSNWVFIKPDEKEKQTDSGIIIPTTAKALSHVSQGVIIHTGRGCLTVSVGLSVTYPTSAATELPDGLVAIREENIFLQS
jgi:co-chaperonin GroES (HSP10)